MHWLKQISSKKIIENHKQLSKWNILCILVLKSDEDFDIL